jgi:hypothetical protein
MRRSIPFFWWAAERARTDVKTAKSTVVTALRRDATENKTENEAEPQSAA